MPLSPRAESAVAQVVAFLGSFEFVFRANIQAAASAWLSASSAVQAELEIEQEIARTFADGPADEGPADSQDSD